MCTKSRSCDTKSGGARSDRLERSGISTFLGLESRSLVSSKPRGRPEDATAHVLAIEPERARVRADDGEDGPIIEGAGTVYDEWYTVGRFFPFREKFAPGAFAKTLADEADIRSMFNHDVSQLLGRVKAGNLEVWETAEELRYRIDVLEDDSQAMSTHAKVKNGLVDGSSIWFSVVREEWTFANEENDLEMDEVVVHEAKLFELGPVVFPANEAAWSQGRSLDAIARGLGVEDDDERREMVLEAMADPERALEALRDALGVDRLPDLRAVCAAAGHTVRQEKRRAAEEAPDETPSDTPLRKHLSVSELELRARALRARQRARERVQV